LSDEPKSTIGEERTANPYLRHKSRGEFVAAVLDGLPEAPQYFAHNAAMNQQGPPPVDWAPKTPSSVEASANLTDPSQYYVVDLRDAQSYAAGHIPNSINIALRGRLETWVGIMVPWEANLVLTGAEEELEEAVYRLHRVGYKAKTLPIAAWREAKLPLSKTKMIEPRELHAQMQSKESPVVVDVRLPNEWMGLRIGTVLNLPLNHLAETASKLDRSQPIVTVCNSAYRSMMAAGVLERAAFKNVSNLSGGGEAWIDAGLPVLEARKDGAADGSPKRVVKLAERIGAAELKRMLMDLPDTFSVVDIRPAAQFADYNLPGSTNVDIAELIDNPAYLTGAGPLVIVDRDGSLAMMAAGILSQKTERRIKALFGGLEAYWREAGPGAGAGAVSGAAIPMSVPSAPSVSPTAPAARTPATAPRKRKSAGC
jgi:rhodanese-related sulfurtransferase